MIITKYRDGSEGYEYEVGDIVRIHKSIGRFNFGQGQTATVHKTSKYSQFEFYCDSESAPVHCHSWDLTPEDVTYATATVVLG